jgi:hypothetical protein
MNLFQMYSFLPRKYIKLCFENVSLNFYHGGFKMFKYMVKTSGQI